MFFSLFSGFESFIVAKIEDAIAQVKKQLIEKQKILSHFEKELVRMHTIFIKVVQVEKERKERKPEKFDPNEVSMQKIMVLIDREEI